jgi:hypothetical protein
LGAVGGDCPTQIADGPGTPDFRLELSDGGKAEVFRVSFGVDRTFLRSCAASVLKQEVAYITCDFLRATDLGCGFCRKRDTEPALNGVGTWTRSNTELTLQVGGHTDSYLYCVDGDTMTLWSRLGFRIVMERVQKSGVPLACEDRDKKQCTTGNGCHLGMCFGGDAGAPDASSGCSSAQLETACTNRVGCSWDPTPCAGSPPRTCNLSDYDVVAGCQFFSPAAKCVGSPAPCVNKTETACKHTGGCTAQPGCSGGSVSCENFGSCGYPCTRVAGCTCNQGSNPGSCSGSATCEMQDYGACISHLFTNCQWVDYICTGTPTPCEKLQLPVCETTEGCRLDLGASNDAGSSSD